MSRENALLEQYTIINSNLNIISEHHNNLFLFMLTSSGAILTFAIQQNNYYIAIINLIILIILRCRIMSYRDQYFAKLSYVREVVEPRLMLDSSELENLRMSKISNVHYFTPSVLSMGTLCLYMLLGFNDYILLIVVVILMLIIIILDIYYFCGSKQIYRKYSKYLNKEKN